MTITTTTPLAPGDQFHFLRDGFTFAVSADFNSDAVISRRGQTVNVTADLIEAAKDRNGDSWLDLIDNEDAQSERYGSPVIARGTGDHLTPWVAGSVRQIWHASRHSRKHLHCRASRSAKRP